MEEALNKARTLCNGDIEEEEGGFILSHNDETYLFEKIKNSNTGQPVARVLYTADQMEVGEKIISHLSDPAYRIFATFHTHPKGAYVSPSNEDLRHIFTAASTNFIYSPSMELTAMYTFDPEEGYWYQKLL